MLYNVAPPAASTQGHAPKSQEGGRAGREGEGGEKGGEGGEGGVPTPHLELPLSNWAVFEKESRGVLEEGGGGCSGHGKCVHLPEGKTEGKGEGRGVTEVRDGKEGCVCMCKGDWIGARWGLCVCVRAYVCVRVCIFFCALCLHDVYIDI